MTTGTLFIIAAPSGAGKTSLVKALLAQENNIRLSVSYTTRPKRPGEENGVHYHFVDQDEFIRMRDDGSFLEWAEVFGNFYGTSREWIQAQMQTGQDIILEIDYQGARQVREIFPQAVGIFILPPSRETLLERLRGRASDSEAVIAKRTADAVNEMRHYHEFDFLVVNDEFDVALKDVQAVVRSRRLRKDAQQQHLQALLDDLLA